MKLTDKVFELLGVEQGEEFGLKNTDDKYRLDERLRLSIKDDAKIISWRRSALTINDLLSGTYEIVKIPHPTERDREIIKALLMLNCKFAAKDKNQVICAYTSKPFKERELEYWDVKQGQSISLDTLTPDDLAFIRWEDAEPVDLEGIV